MSENWRRIVSKEPDGMIFDEMPIKHLTGSGDLSLKRAVKDDFLFPQDAVLNFSYCSPIPKPIVFTQADIDILLATTSPVDPDRTEEYTSIMSDNRDTTPPDFDTTHDLFGDLPAGEVMLLDDRSDSPDGGFDLAWEDALNEEFTIVRFTDEEADELYRKVVAWKENR